MSDYDITNTGALFKNNKKENEKHPDYKGSVNVGGAEYWLSAWLKTSKQGNKFMSLSVKARDAAPQRQAAKPAQEDSDDTPF